MENEKTCPSCGSPLSPKSKDGEICPACMLEKGFMPDESGDAPLTLGDTTTLALDGSSQKSPGKTPISGRPADMVSPAITPQSTHKIPSIDELGEDFPELEIIELIGRGGMGAVFKARQESLDRFVALKVLPEEWNVDDTFRERFAREARTLAALNHPNIVTIHDFGERNGRFFFTMECVDGTDLARMIHDGEMPPEQALGLIPPVCEAIQFAHDHGIVHRDIKPGNILVGRDGRVKVVDFGIAKLGKSSPTPKTENDQEADIDSSLTDPDGVLGTPRYMAPEQAQGSELLDHRADLYALGVVFYEMLVGKPPEKDVILVPPSSGSSIDRKWDRIILRALEKDPEKRYQNATEIKTAVESVLREKKRLIPRWAKAAAFVSVSLLAAIALWPQRGTTKNSIGMEFVKVPGIEGTVSIWETRVRDYEVFLEETGTPWNKPEFDQGPDHPAVHVSWHEANAFCRWLTKRERESGALGPEEYYRLPTDREWSTMVQLRDEEGATPQERHLGQGSIYPWGEKALIPEGAGNYPDEAAREPFASHAVAGYSDGFAATSPVGSFSSNRHGLFDLGGNVWEWTNSPHSSEDGRPVIRGGGWWASQADDGWKSLLASFRKVDVEASDASRWDVGFRVVRGPLPTEEERADLFQLILNGDLEGIRESLEKGADVNASNGAGQPPIVAAAETGNLDLVKLLAEKGARLDASDRRARTPLHVAAELGDLEMARWLLEQGVKGNPRTIDAREPLFLALRRGSTELLELLLANTDPNVLVDSSGPEKAYILPEACLVSPDVTLTWILDRLTPTQFKALEPAVFIEWTSVIALRNPDLVSQFLSKTSNHIPSQAFLWGCQCSLNYDSEENFHLFYEAAGQPIRTKQNQNLLVQTAASRGRPWGIKFLLSDDWTFEDYSSGNKTPLLFETLMTKSGFNEMTRPLFGKAARENRRMQRILEIMTTKIPRPATRETIRFLAEAGLDIETRNERDRTALNAAAMAGNLEAVETLLDLGAELEVQDNEGFTALLSAVENGNLEVVKALHRKGADLAAVTSDNRGALHVVRRSSEVLEYLLQNELDIELRNEDGATPLLYLAIDGDEEIISLFIKAGADVRTVGTGGLFSGVTPLHLASMIPTEREQKDGEKQMITQDHLGGSKYNPYPTADREERMRSIRLLVEAGADPSVKNAQWMTPLHFAAKSGLPEAVELFLEKGANPNGLTKILNSPIHLAASWGNTECVRILLEHEAVTESPIWKFPLAISAVNGGKPEIVKMLLEHDMPIDKRGVEGAFPLHFAAMKGKEEIVEILIDAGAEIEATDLKYRTPAHIAAGANSREVINLLRKKGARMNARDLYNSTPAMVASASGHEALAQHLRRMTDGQ